MPPLSGPAGKSRRPYPAAAVEIAGQAASRWNRSRKAAEPFGQSRMTLPVLCPARRSLFRSHAVEPLCPLRSLVKGACVPDGVSVADSFLKRVCSLAGAPRIFYGNYFGQIYARIGKRQGAFPKKREDSSRRNCLLVIVFRGGFPAWGSVQIPVLVLCAVG